MAGAAPAAPVAGRWRRPGLIAAACSAPTLALATLLGAGLGFLQKAACRSGAWNSGYGEFHAHCYTDIYPLYFGEQLASRQIPYFDHHVEYPVLLGGAMQLVSWLVEGIANPYTRGREFFDVTVVLLTLFAVAGVLATGYLAGPGRQWTALLVALSPALILSAFINWDLIAMGLTALGMAAWAARRLAVAGMLLGLAVATKFYPIVFFGPLLLLCWRAGRLRAFWVTFGSAAAAWLVVNLPVAIGANSGWATFYILSEKRGADWGCVWYFLEYLHWPVLGTTAVPGLNKLSAVFFVLGCLGIAVLTLAAPRRARLPQVCFLVLAVFLMTNKVWSPQYVIWLAPLAVLARPRLWSWALWQAAEVVYFFAIWSYLLTASSLPDGISPALYFTALMARFVTVGLLCGLVVKDVLRPGTDVVRTGGVDDPAGGVLAGAEDRVLLRLRPRIRLAPPEMAPPDPAPSA